MTPTGSAGASNADGWICRSCACVERAPYAYPKSPWVYCVRCGGALTPNEQLIALAGLHLERVAEGAPAAGTSTVTTSQSTASERPLMTVADVATFFGKGKQAIYKMIERNQLAGVTRVGRRLYVRRSDLLRSLAEGRVLSPGRSR